MRTKEELNAIKKEVETMNKEFADLTAEELKKVSGGVGGVCGGHDGMMNNNADIVDDSMPGSGNYSPGTCYGGICGSPNVHYDRIV